MEAKLRQRAIAFMIHVQFMSKYGCMKDVPVWETISDKLSQEAEHHR